MGVGTSIVTFAVGAVLDFAVKVQTSGFNIHTVGVILMIVGGIGFVVSLFFWNSWGGIGGYSRRTVVRHGYDSPSGSADPYHSTQVVEEERHGF